MMRAGNGPGDSGRPISGGDARAIRQPNEEHHRAFDPGFSPHPIPSHEPAPRTVAFRPRQCSTVESARKQSEGCGPHCLRFMGGGHGSETKAASHEPGRDGFHSVPDFTLRSERQFQGRGGTRPYQFMGRVHGSKAVEALHEPGVGSAAFTPLDAPMPQALRNSKRRERRAPVQGFKA